MTNEILTVEEVAQYLRVTEQSVIEWAEKGEIPAGKLGDQWRFKKSEIERWVNARLTSEPNLNPETEIKIRNILSTDRIVFIEKNTKIDALNQLSSVLGQAPQIKDRAELSKEILKREELMSTAIGRGIAIPHVRLASVTDLVMAIGICKTPLTDFGALDDEPVNLMIMIAAAHNQHSYYLKTISHISSILKQDDLRNAILNAKTQQDAYKVLTSN